MKKNISGLLAVSLAVVLTMGMYAPSAIAAATSGPAFNPMSSAASKMKVPGIGPGNKTEEAINDNTQAVADNTETAVKQNNEAIDTARIVGATSSVTQANAAHLAEGLRDRRNRVVEQKRRSNDQTERLLTRRQRSTSDNAEEGTPDGLSDMMKENAHVRKVAQETFDKAKDGLFTDKEMCTGTNCQMKKFREQQNRDLLGIKNVADLFRNGCNELGICDMMAKYITSVKGTVLADVGVATKKNLATLIAAGAGGDDYTGSAMNLCKLNRNNNELQSGAQGVKASLLAGVVAIGQGEHKVDLYRDDRANSIDGMDADLRRLAEKQRATQAFSDVVERVKDSYSRVGGCQAQQAMDKGITQTGEEGSKGKCYSNNMLRDSAVPASQQLSRKANRANPGGGNQSLKQDRASNRARDSANAVLGNPSGSCAGGSNGGANSSSAVSSIFLDPKFAQMLKSKEFLVAYIDAPKEGEGSFYDSVNIMIANAWQKYEGNGAFMYANLMLNNPKMYASNAVKYAALFNFKAMPYEKGNMIAMKEHEKGDPNYNFYTQRIEKDPPVQVANLNAPMPAPDTAIAAVAAPQVVATKELPVIDMSNITLQQLFQKVGVNSDANGAVVIPASEMVQPTVAPKKDEELRVDNGLPSIAPHAMKATLVSTAGIAK